MAKPKDNISQIAEFMTAMGQYVSQGWEDQDGINLGMDLIEEEFWELDTAANRISENPDNPKYRENFVKELADLLYVVYWMAARVGIDVDKAFRLVHASNMSKLGPDGKPILRDDGKVLKGPNYKEPELSEVLASVPIALR